MPEELRDETPTSPEWKSRVKDELDELRSALDAIVLPAKETPIVRNTVEGISVTLRAVHRQMANLATVLADLADLEA